MLLPHSNLQTFETYLQSKGLSPATIDRYKRLVVSFEAWYGSEDIINCQKKDILNYLSRLNNRNLQAISRNNALIALRHCFDYLLSQDLTASNPTALIKLRGLNKRKLHHTCTPEELTELADAYYFLEVKRTQEKQTAGAGQYLFERAYQAKMRNYTMLLFFIHQGLTTKEILRLQTEDIQLNKAMVTIPKGTQRGNARTLPLHATQTGVLMQYLNEIRPRLETNNTDETLFLPIPKNDPKAKKEAEASFKGFVRQLKRLNKNFSSFEQVRASVITFWIKTQGLRKAQYLAGHKSIVSTEEYLPNYIEDLAEDITKFNPF